MSTCNLAKDVHNLLRNIDGMSGGQAKVLEWDEDNLGCLTVEVAPTDGYYKGGKFKFKIDISVNDYPRNAPNVNCMTPIYHPNIDTVSEELWPREDDDSGNTNICLNIFDVEWNEGMNLEDCVQGLLFLLYNPNFEDPLTPLFDSTTCSDMEEFAENVSLSLIGGNVEGIEYETNYGLADAGDVVNDILTDLIDQVVPVEDIKNVVDEKGEVSQIENETQKLAGTEILCQDILCELIQQISVEKETEQNNDTNIDDESIQEESEKVQKDLIDKVKVSEGQQVEDKVVNVYNPDDQNSDNRIDQGCDKNLEAVGSEQGCSAEVSEKVKDIVNTGDLYSEVKDLNENQNIINASMICDNKKLVLRSDSYIEKCNNFETFAPSNDVETKECVQKLDSTKLPSTSV